MANWSVLRAPDAAKVWLDYTQEELDYNYNQRALVTNFEEYFEFNDTESERVRAKLDGRLDIYVANGFISGKSLKDT